MSLTDNAQTYLQYTPVTNSPDVAGGNDVQLFGTNIRETLSKDITYIPIPKGYDAHVEGADTLALDFLKTEFVWEVTALIFGKNNGDKLHSLPDTMLDSNDDGTVVDEELDFRAYSDSTTPSHEWLLLGSTGIKHGSETLSTEQETFSITGVDTTNETFTVNGDQTDHFDTDSTFTVTGSTGNDGNYTVTSQSYNSDNDNTVITVDEDITDSTADGTIQVGTTGTLTRGTDYNIDYDRGRIEVFDTANTALGATYKIDYTFDGSAYNVARTVRRMSQLGGNAKLKTDETEYTSASGTSAAEYMVQFTTVEISRVPTNPNRVEIVCEMRVALDRGA